MDKKIKSELDEILNKNKNKLDETKKEVSEKEVEVQNKNSF